MKQRSKILTALFLSASLAVTPAASVSVLAENLDVAAVEDVTVVPEEDRRGLCSRCICIQCGRSRCIHSR